MFALQQIHGVGRQLHHGKKIKIKNIKIKKIKKMINLAKYSELKEKNLISISKVGSAFVVYYEQFDPQTGIKLDPIVEALDVNDLKNQKLQLLSLMVMPMLLQK